MTDRSSRDSSSDGFDIADVDLDELDDLHTSARVRRREERRAARRRRARFVGLGTLSVVVAALVVLVATDTLRWRGPSPSFADGTSAVRTPGNESAAATLEQAGDVERRPLSHGDPLRLWIAGDSLAGSMGVRLAEQAKQSGVVAARLDYRVSSGIHDAGLRDWPVHAAEQVAAHDPEAIVFMIGTNDTVIVGDTGWEDGYRDEVAEMMDVLVGDDPDRLVLWLSVPTLGDSELHSGAQEINDIMRTEADERPQVLYVDSFRLFGDPNGEYAQSVAVPGQGTTQVRIDDGVHFTDAGATYLADNLWSALEAIYEVARYQEPDTPIDWVETAGSGGGSSSGSSSGSSGSGSSASSSGGSGSDDGVDTAPTTLAPPVTDPPVTEAPDTTPETTEPATSAPVTVPTTTTVAPEGQDAPGTGA